MGVRRLVVAGFVTLSVVGLTVVVPVAPAAANGPVERVRMVSATEDGRPGADHSGYGGYGVRSDRSASEDGRYVAFHSSSDDLAPAYPPCPGSCTDVFVKDVWTGRVEQVSVGTGDAAPIVPRLPDPEDDDYYYRSQHGSDDASISADGRYVVFVSSATNLVPGGSTGTQVFRHDRTTGVTEVVSVTNLPDRSVSAIAPSISDDGRFVAYATYNDNETGIDQIYLQDVVGATTTLVSDTVDDPFGRGSWDPVVSGDGRFVAYVSTLTGLIEDGPTGHTSHVYRWDRLAGATELVSRATAGAEADGDSLQPSISRDGSLVAFVSRAFNLGIPDHTSKVFVRDLGTAQTGLVSQNSDGAEANDRSRDPSISADGRFVAFASSADNLAGADADQAFDVFVRDRWQGTTARVSLTASGAEPEPREHSQDPSITPDGTQVVFSSDAENLVLDGNNRRDVFVGPADGVQVPPAVPLTITGLSCVRPAPRTVTCTVTYTGGTRPVWIRWSVNSSSPAASRDQTTMTWRCQPLATSNLTIGVVVTDDLLAPARSDTSARCVG